MALCSWHRRALLACVVFAGLASLPAVGMAATAPTLSSPAAKADPIAEGGSVKFSWKGELQGDPAALNRSFFRVELIPAADAPAGAQAEWPEDKLENFEPTTPGSTVGEVSLGVPSAGSYKWRVCAWGVLDVLVSNDIQQLPGGCSAARSLTSVAAATNDGVIGKIDMEQRKHVDGRVTTVYVPREDQQQATVVDPPVRRQPAGPVVVSQPEPPASFQPLGSTDRRSGKGSSLGLGAGGGESLKADDAAGRSGIGHLVRGGLGSTLPLVPIPFWTLALLLACVPILVVWRRSMLGMFDWEDGSIDGLGTMSDAVPELAYVPVARNFKDGSKSADGTAVAPQPIINDDAPEGRRHAA